MRCSFLDDAVTVDTRGCLRSLTDARHQSPPTRHSLGSGLLKTKNASRRLIFSVRRRRKGGARFSTLLFSPPSRSVVSPNAVGALDPSNSLGICRRLPARSRERAISRHCRFHDPGALRPVQSVGPLAFSNGVDVEDSSPVMMLVAFYSHLVRVVDAVRQRRFHSTPKSIRNIRSGSTMHSIRASFRFDC